MTARATGAASSRSKPAARASRRGSLCGVHSGRAAPTTLAAKTGSAFGQAMRPARPRRSNRPAAMLRVSSPVRAACRRGLVVGLGRLGRWPERPHRRARSTVRRCSTTPKRAVTASATSAPERTGSAAVMNAAISGVSLSGPRRLRRSSTRPAMPASTNARRTCAQIVRVQNVEQAYPSDEDRPGLMIQGKSALAVPIPHSWRRLAVPGDEIDVGPGTLRLTDGVYEAMPPSLVSEASTPRFVGLFSVVGVDARRTFDRYRRLLGARDARTGSCRPGPVACWTLGEIWRRARKARGIHTSCWLWTVAMAIGGSGSPSARTADLAECGRRVQLGSTRSSDSRSDADANVRFIRRGEPFRDQRGARRTGCARPTVSSPGGRLG